MGYAVVASAACVVGAALVGSYLKSLRDLDNLPGYRPMFSPLSLIGLLLPVSPWNLGRTWYWEIRDNAYFNKTHDIISIIPWFRGESAYYISSPEVAKELLSSESQSPMTKPRWLNEILIQWGENLFSSNGDMWKRHRRIMTPAFNRKTYTMVVQETTKLYKDMIEYEGWDKKSSIDIEEFAKHTLRTTFLVIARCGFGIPLTWEAEQDDKMSPGNALAVVLETLIHRLVIPKWLYKLPSKALQELDQTWTSLSRFMEKSVDLRLQELAHNPEVVTKRGDVFTRLVAATDATSKYSLDKDEVIGNTFLLMFAGHETTGMVLAETVAFLGIYQEEQEKVYQEIMSVIGADRDPTLDDVQSLTHTLACFAETARLYPAGPMLTRSLPEDTPLRVHHPAESTVVLKKDTLIVFDMIAIHRNPRAFPEPNKFIPSRWYGVSEHDLTMFGMGPRACIGRKFGQIEALTFLSMFLRDWRVDVNLKDGETREDYENRVMMKGGFVGITFGVTEDISLRLTRRN